MEHILNRELRLWKCISVVLVVLYIIAVIGLVSAIANNQEDYWKGKYDVLESIRVDYMPAPMDGTMVGEEE